MGGLYLVLIIFPLIFLVVLSFIFSQSLNAIGNQQFLANCPYPINSGIASISSIDDNNNVIYTVTYDNSTGDYHLTLFECQISGGLPNANTVVYTQSATNWFGVGTGYLAYYSNSISSFFQKSYALIIELWLFYDAPAQVTGLSFFTYINLMLSAFIGLGIFMGIRGIGN